MRAHDEVMATAADKKENSSKQANTEGKEGSESLRGNLVQLYATSLGLHTISALPMQVDVAVKFLNNPRVVNSPLDQKKAFLKKKGSSSEMCQLPALVLLLYSHRFE